MSKDKKIKLPSPEIGRMKVRIDGITPLMQNRWRQSVIESMENQQQGAAKTKKQARDPDAEFQEILAAASVGGSTYGHPAEAFVEAMASAGHRHGDWTNKGPTIKGAVTIRTSHDLVPLDADEPVMDVRPVRIKNTWTIAYRPRYDRWGAVLDIDYDKSIFTQESLLHLLMTAGRTVGVGSFRKERGGQFGLFEVTAAELA